MRVFNHELTVHRNESFTIDKIIQNRDGSPYIISSELKNPYFVITVSSTLYPTDDGYTFHAWLPISVPRFNCTVPVNIRDFKQMNGDDAYPNGFDSMPGFPAAYLNDVNTEFEEGDALFYYDDENGNRIYKYGAYNDKGEFEWRDYECRIVYKFLQEITSQWIERSYYYGIELIDGSAKAEVKDNDRPIDNINEVIPILEPTKLSVLSNLKGGMNRWK